MGEAVTFIIGIIICILAISNMRGNISSLHSYHRNRVRPEDVKPFGKLVGLGTLIIGISIIAFSVLMFIALKTEVEAYTLIGTGVMIAGLVVGMIISFYAMKKYNGGII